MDKVFQPLTAGLTSRQCLCYSAVVAQRGPIAIGEWYHCYTRGVDKRVVFETSIDFDRFLLHLYVGNATNTVRLSNLRDRGLQAVLTNDHIDRGDSLVDIGAYSLMPTHAHLVLRATREEGIAQFMQKVFTGYTQYFNNKRQRTGALFSGTYKSKHISDDRYLKQVVPYVLLNPVELFEPQWKEGAGNLTHIEKSLLGYRYSSFQDFYDIDRLEKKIVSDALSTYYDSKPTIEDMLKNAQEYYKEQCPEL